MAKNNSNVIDRFNYRNIKRNSKLFFVLQKVSCIALKLLTLCNTAYLSINGVLSGIMHNFYCKRWVVTAIYFRRLPYND